MPRRRLAEPLLLPRTKRAICAEGVCLALNSCCLTPVFSGRTSRAKRGEDGPLEHLVGRHVTHRFRDPHSRLLRSSRLGQVANFSHTVSDSHVKEQLSQFL